MSRLLIAVAIVGLILGIGLIGTRWRTYRARAAMYRQMADSMPRLREGVDPRAPAPHFGQRRIGGGAWAPVSNEDVDLWARQTDALARKYERAARRPWLPVAPDPPASGW